MYVSDHPRFTGTDDIVMMLIYRFSYGNFIIKYTTESSLIYDPCDEHVMAKRKSQYRYTPARFQILNHLMEELYGGMSKGTSELRPEELGTTEFPPHYRHNDIQGIVRSFDDGLFIRGAVVRSDNGTDVRSVVNRENTKKIVEDFRSKGFLTRCDNNVRNRKLYYPVETYDGFTHYIDYIMGFMSAAGGPIALDDQGAKGFMKDGIRKASGTGRYFDDIDRSNDLLLDTHYCRLMMDRGAILNRLRSMGKDVGMIISGNGRDYMVRFPPVGRYPRVYEDREPFERFLTDCLELKERISELSDAEIVLDLMEKERPDRIPNRLANDCKHTKDDITRYLDDVISAVRDEKTALERMSTHLDGRSDPRQLFDLDPDSTRRMESSCASLGIAPEDERELESRMRIYERSNGRWIEIPPDGLDDGIRDDILECVLREYPSAVDEHLILPTLCLAQMSPSAMVMLMNSRSAWCSDSGEMIMLNPETVGAVDRELFKAALADLMAGRDRKFIGWSTRYAGFGEYKIDGKTIPALLTFRLNALRYLSFHGGTFKSPLEEACFDLPYPIEQTTDSLRVSVVGDITYSQHLVNLLIGVVPASEHFSIPSREAMNRMKMLLKYSAITGEMPKVFRPHKA